MLKTVKTSTANKTRGCAVTYRSGINDIYGTCPSNCALAPEQTDRTAKSFDQEYFNAELHAVPKGGRAFTYTHYSPELWQDKLTPKTTIINYSADHLTEAVNVFETGVPVVTVVPPSFWNNTNKKSKYVSIYGKAVPVVRCENETTGVDCINCGNGNPWCARLNRDFIVAFTAHGAQKKLASNTDKKGGCYAGNGNCAIHWRATLNAVKVPQTDGEKLLQFIKELPRGTLVRHRIAGDYGTDLD
tara:strand:+ start:216 stop:947 length:732 start_codon:yes stop_codon:yes gene_type:complete